MRSSYLVGGVAGGITIVAAAAIGTALAPGWALTRLTADSAALLGRPVTAQSVHLELMPQLGLRFDDVRLAGPAGTELPMLAAQSLSLPLGFGGLLSHRASLSGATFSGANINIVIDEMGRVNWPAVMAAAPGRINFDNATLAVSDARTGQQFSLTQIEAAAELGEAGDVTVDGSAITGGALLKFNGYLKDVARATSGGSPAALTLAAPQFNITFNGRLATTGGLGLAGTVSVDGPDARQALAWIGAVVPGSKGFSAFSAAGSLDAVGQAFAVHGATVKLDDVQAQGDFSLDFRADTPKLSAALKTSALALSNYLPATDFDGADWSAARLNFKGLRGIDADLHLEAAKLAAGRLDLGGAVVDVKLAGGRMDASVAADTLPDFKLTLDGSGDVEGMAVGLRSLDPAGLLGALAHLDWLTGPGTLTASLQATGGTVQEMVSTLKGDGQLVMHDGSAHGFDMAHALAAVSRDIQTGWPASPEGHSEFANLTAKFSVADGIAAVKPFTVTGSRFSMSASGDIDFLRRALDLRADPRLITEGTGASVGLPVAVVVRGPWEKPKIYPDMANILSNPGAAYADLKGLGMPVLPDPPTAGN